MRLRDLMEERGWSNDDVAAILAERGVAMTQGPSKGQYVTPQTINGRAHREIPKSWREALGVSADDGPVGVEGEPASARAGTDGEKRRPEQAPRRPDEAPVLLPIPSPGAKKRISGAHRFLGAMLAQGAGSQGVAVVWNDAADPIADLWVQAAAENPWAARFVAVMETGGTLGDLAGAYTMLAGATLYVLGSELVPEAIGDTVWAKYSRYRPRPRPADPGANGRSERTVTADEPAAAYDPAAGPVVDGTG